VQLPDRMQAIRTRDIRRAQLLKALSHVTADTLDFETWLALGGRFVVAKMSDNERKSFESAFSSLLRVA